MISSLIKFKSQEEMLKIYLLAKKVLKTISSFPNLFIVVIHAKGSTLKSSYPRMELFSTLCK